jgi:hypothetical protein
MLLATGELKEMGDEAIAFGLPLLEYLPSIPSGQRGSVFL